jgi:parvulin-like peptidyl-prolyl isomerase
MERARKLAAALKAAPQDFPVFARKLSNHPSAAKGGDMGFVDRGKLPPVLERIIFAKDLKLPALVGPVATDEGIYLVRVIARRESEALPFSQVRKKIKQQLLMQRMQVRTGKWIEQLRKKTYIDIRL